MSGMYSAIDRHLPDQVIHLGDLLQDAEMLADIYPRLPICRVPGNCDGWTTEPLKRQITLAGKQFLLSHAISDAKAAQVDVLLFGHTHRSLCHQLEDGLWVMNPGSSRSSYGFIEIKDGTLHCEIFPVN